jgi:hypothetical protein
MDDQDAVRYERRLHRVFAPDSKPYDGRPVYENLPAYDTPPWLTGGWTGGSSGAATPSRAESGGAPAPVSPCRPSAVQRPGDVRSRQNPRVS